MNFYVPNNFIDIKCSFTNSNLTCNLFVFGHFQEKVDTLTAASTAVTPSQIVPSNENLLQPQTMASTATNTSILGNPNQQTVCSIAL